MNEEVTSQNLYGKRGGVGLQVSEQVENARGTRESGGSAHAEARPRAICRHPPGPAGRPRPAPSLTHLEPPRRAASGAAELTGFLSPEQPRRLLSWGEGTGSSRNQFPVLLHPLTHPSTAKVFKRLTRLSFTWGL